MFISTRLLPIITLFSSVLADPSLVGSLSAGLPSWELTIPTVQNGQPWLGASIVISSNGSTGFFDYSDYTIFADGRPFEGAFITKTNSLITLEISNNFSSFSNIVFRYGGIPRSGNLFTSFARVSLTLPDTRKLAKRAVIEFYLSATVDTSAVTSTVTATDVATTVVTVTSCGTNTCSLVPVTTGVTVVTVTHHGFVTQYTTYCPLPTTATANHGTTTHHGAADTITYAAAASSSHTSTSTRTSTVSATVSTFRGSAAKPYPGIFAMVAALLLIN